MKIRVPSYYKQFKCIASACEDTCCAGWDVAIDSRSYEEYLNLEGAFGERLRSKMRVDEDGDIIFILDGKRCPFLNNQNYCDIYTEAGEDYLCYTCQQYPRYVQAFGDLQEMGISLSCPEAARIILRDTKATSFEFSEDRQVVEKLYGDEADILEDFFRSRAVMIDILESEELTLGESAATVLEFVEELQDKIDFGEMDGLHEVTQKYSSQSYLKALKKDLQGYKGNKGSQYDDVFEYFKTYRDLEHINENDPINIGKALETYWKHDEDRVAYINGHQGFNQYYKTNMWKFKKLLFYFIYRYFMKSFFDYELLSKIKVALISTVMIKELGVLKWQESGSFSEEDLVELSHMYSKDVEHLEVNIQTLEKIFETDDVYQVDGIINTLIQEF